MSMLIVDDEQRFGRPLAELLRRDFEVNFAKTGAEALQYLDKFSCRLILLDLGLLGGVGVEAVRRIRARGVRTPIIAIVGDKEFYDYRSEFLDLDMWPCVSTLSHPARFCRDVAHVIFKNAQA